MFVAAVVLIIVATIMAVSLRNGGEENGQVNINAPYEGYITSLAGGDGQGASQPASKTMGSITATQLSDGRALLENKKDNYQIIVTSDWMLPEEVGEGFVLYYGEPEILEKCFERCDNVAVLNIEVLDNGKQYNFDTWFKNLDAFISGSLGAKNNYKEIMINGQMSFRGSRKYDQPYSEMPRDDSLIINYLFFDELKVYRVKCASSGSDYKKLIQVCENQVKNFSIK